MQPRPKPLTRLERVERWFRKRSNLKRLTRAHQANEAQMPHPLPRWMPGWNEPVPWSALVLDGERAWPENLRVARRYAKLRYGREMRDGEARTLKAEWEVRRAKVLRKGRET